MCFCVWKKRPVFIAFIILSQSASASSPFHYFGDAALFLTVIFSLTTSPLFSELKAAWCSVNKSCAGFRPLRLPAEALSILSTPPKPSPSPSIIPLCLVPLCDVQVCFVGATERNLNQEAGSQGCPKRSTLLAAQDGQLKGVGSAETLKFCLCVKARMLKNMLCNMKSL